MSTDFYGHPVISLTSDHLRLDVLAEAGPRIVRLMLAGSDDNLLAEVPGKGWDTPYGYFALFGGHRLWHAPEASPRSYIPDSDGVRVERTERGAVLSRVEAGTSIAKRVEIELDPGRPAVTLHHTLENAGLWPVELAPWAITQLALGGIAVLPQTQGPLDADGLLPNRHLVLWPYTSWADTRLHLADDYILVEAQPTMPPVKIGTLNRAGWLGYFHGETFFCKRFDPRPAEPYPDFGSNAEVYCNDAFVELETLGPLVRLEPDEATHHTETWEAVRTGEQPALDAVREALDALGL